MGNVTGDQSGKGKRGAVKKRAQTKAAAKRRKRMDGKCSWRNDSGQKCTVRSYYTDVTTGESYCRTHYAKYFAKGEAEHMEAHRVNCRVTDQLKERKGKKVTEALAEKPSKTGAIEEALQTVEDFEAGHNADEVLQPRTKIKRSRLERLTSHGVPSPMKKADFVGIDIDFYTPDFKDDYFLLLNSMIKRKHAICNILMQQLLKMEDEEETIKLIETYGEQIVDGEAVSFQNITKRHATPIELKLKLLETLNKHEKEYRELLKQRADLLPNAILILKRYGIKFDKKSGMMIVDLLSRIDASNMEAVGAIDTTASETGFARIGDNSEEEYKDPVERELKRTLDTVQDEDW